MKKKSHIIWTIIITIEIFIIYLLSISFFENNFSTNSNNFSLTTKDFTCQNGKFVDEKFYINEKDKNDENFPLLFTYGVNRELIAGTYQINIQYQSTSNNNYVEISYYDNKYNFLNKEIVYLETSSNNFIKTIELDKKTNVEIKTYYGNIGELELSQISSNLIRKNENTYIYFAFVSILILVNLLLFFVLKRKNKEKKQNQELLENENRYKALENINQINSSQLNIDEIDTFFNEWLTAEKYNKIEKFNNEEINYYNNSNSSIVEHQIEDITNIDFYRKPNEDYLKYIEYKNISNPNFAIFRYTEEDFNMTEDYEIGFRK